jgi:hypothetical protein
MRCELQATIKQLTASGSYRVRVTLPVQQALDQLSTLRASWSQKPLSSPVSLPPEECYRFLASLGLVYRSHLGTYSGSLLPSKRYQSTRPATKPNYDRQWRHLYSQYEPVIGWAVTVFQEHGVMLAAQALSICYLEGWCDRAEELAADSEFADPESWCDDSVQNTTNKAIALLQQLDDAELVHALATLAIEFLHTPSPSEQAWQPNIVFDKLRQDLDTHQASIRKCLDWLGEHPEAFLLADDWIVTLGAGLREDLEDFADLDITTWKFSDLLDALAVADGISFPQESRDWLTHLLEQAITKRRRAMGIKELADWLTDLLEQAITATAGSEVVTTEAAEMPILCAPASSPMPRGEPEEHTAEAAEIPTGRLYLETVPLIPTLAYPRTILHSLLAAASGHESGQRVLSWSSPDQRYQARLLLGAQECVLRFYRCLEALHHSASAGAQECVLRFYHQSGQRAQELEGQRFCLAGCIGRIGAEAQAVLDRMCLEKSGQDIYLDVGEPPQRWIPVTSPPTQQAAKS